MKLAPAIMTQGFGHVLLPAPGLGVAQWGQSASPSCWGSKMSLSEMRKEVGCYGEN